MHSIVPDIQESIELSIPLAFPSRPLARNNQHCITESSFDLWRA